MEKFLQELLGTIDLPSYAAWMLIALIGAILGILIRQVYSKLKDYPTTWRQMVIGFIITFLSIRFSNDWLGLEPTAFGALISGLTYNEIALGLLKKYLNKKED
jgi:CHASE2 domain-containing sensor protein